MEHIVSGKQVTWSGNRGITDASALDFPPGVFPDAVNVRSPRTERVVRFVRTLRSPTQHVYRSVGLDEPVSLVVFND